jgi:hypothetical protein
MNCTTSSIMNNNATQHVPRGRRKMAATMGVLLATVSSVGGFTTSLHKRLLPSGRPTTMKLPTRKTKTRPELSIRGIPASSALSMISEDQQEFEMKVGHAMDVLRTDYPGILTFKPGKKWIKRDGCVINSVDIFIQKSNFSLRLLSLHLL